MMRAFRILRGVLLTAMFLFLLHFSLRYLGHVLFPRGHRVMDDGKDWGQDYGQYYFSRARRDSFDTVFIGSSHQYCSIDPNLLNREYGQNCILLTSSSMGLQLAYYAVMEAVELQHPKMIVLECYETARVMPEMGPVVMEKHYFLDDMPNWLKTKWHCVRSIGDPPYLYYYPITAMHSYVFDRGMEDFRLPPKLPEGECYCYHYDVTTPLERWEIIPAEESWPLAEYSEKWLRDIAALCRKNDIELILYIAPFSAPPWAQVIFNGLETFAQSENLKYFNLMSKIDEIGLDVRTDYNDSEHLNCRGQEKLTRYLGQLLTELHPG